MNRLTLLLLLVLFVTACDKEAIKNVPEPGPYIPIPEPTEEDPMERFWRLYTYEYRVTDTTDLVVMGISSLSEYTYLSGTRNGKLWFAKFGSSSKKQLMEYTDTEDFPISQQCHIGGGNYETFETTTINLQQIKENEEGELEVAIFQISNPDRPDYTIYREVIIFPKSEIWSKYFYTYPKSSVSSFELSIRNWYENSYILYYDPQDEDNSNSIRTCFSPTGEIITYGYMANITREYITPINHDEYLAYLPMTGDILQIHVFVNKVGLGNHKAFGTIEFPFTQTNLTYKMHSLGKDEEENTATIRFVIMEYTGLIHTYDVKINLENGRHTYF